MKHKRKEPDSASERGVSSCSNKKKQERDCIGYDCWETIFGYLDQTEDRLSVLLTCKQWNEMGTRFLDPSVNDNIVIRWASKKGHDKEVERVLKDERVDPTVRGNYPIRRASANGYHKVVRILLKDERVDPTAGSNEPIKMACINEHCKVMNLLLEDKRVDPAVKDIYRLLAQDNPSLLLEK